MIYCNKLIKIKYFLNIQYKIRQIELLKLIKE